MKNKAILFFVIALFAIAFALNTVVAADFVKDTDIEVTINDIVAGSGVTVAGPVSETVPVEAGKATDALLPNDAKVMQAKIKTMQ